MIQFLPYAQERPTNNVQYKNEYLNFIVRQELT
jgi:hypothetical protein